MILFVVGQTIYIWVWESQDYLCIIYSLNILDPGNLPVICNVCFLFLFHSTISDSQILISYNLISTHPKLILNKTLQLELFTKLLTSQPSIPSSDNFLKGVLNRVFHVTRCLLFAIQSSLWIKNQFTLCGVIPSYLLNRRKDLCDRIKKSIISIGTFKKLGSLPRILKRLILFLPNKQSAKSCSLVGLPFTHSLLSPNIS